MMRTSNRFGLSHRIPRRARRESEVESGLHVSFSGRERQKMVEGQQVSEKAKAKFQSVQSDSLTNTKKGFGVCVTL